MDGADEELLDLRLRVEALERDLERTSALVGERTALLDVTFRSRAWRVAELLRQVRAAAGPAAAVAAGEAGPPPGGLRVPLAGLLEAGPAAADPRWRDAVTVAGVALPGLLADPPAGHAWRLDTRDAATTVRTFAALRPGAWVRNRGGVRFTLVARDAAGTVLAETARTVHPGHRRADRGWLPLSLSLPPAPDLRLELVTDVPQDGPAAFAWAVWGDPVLLVGAGDGVVTGIPDPDVRTGARRLARVARGVRRRAADAPTDAAPAVPDGAPSLSLLMPVHDPDPETLARTLRSVTGQTDPGWQLCIVDDGSRDPAVLDLLRVAAADPRVVADRHATAAGIAAATNRALGHATGTYVATLDHDDLLAPAAVATVRAELARRPDTDVLYSDNDKVHGAGAPFSPSLKPGWSPDLLRACMYTLHLGVYRRTLVDAVGGWRSAMDGAQDHDLVLRLTERTDRVVHVPATLYSWRAHAGSAALGDGAKPWAYEAGARAVREHLSRVGVAAEVEQLPVPGRFRVVHPRGDERIAVVTLHDGDRGALERAVAGAPDVALAPPADPATPWTQRIRDALAQTDAEVVVLVDAAATAPAGTGWAAELVGPLRESRVVGVAPVVVDAEDRAVAAGVALVGGLPLPLHPGAPVDGPEVPADLTMVTDRSAADAVVALRRVDLVRLLDDAADTGPGLVALTAALTAGGGSLLVTPHAPWRTTAAPRPVPLAAVRAFRDAHPQRVDPYVSPRAWTDRAAGVVPTALLRSELLADLEG